MPWLHRFTCRRCFGRSVASALMAVPVVSTMGRLARAQPATDAPLNTRSHLLDTAADALQTKRPLDAMSAYLNGFHFYADDMGRQVEAHHFCTHLSEDFHQCVIYDGNAGNAKLIGVEYIVSERVFKSLPEDEKRLWHSHDYEVRSGELVAPGVPLIAEHAVMKDLASTYGKTWHTWQIDRDPALPLGIPQLMMGFVQDGQVNPAMLQARDSRLRTDTRRAKDNRSDIPEPEVDPAANSWRSGRTVQLALQDVPMRNLRG
ncbi:MAG: OBAP family protein [Acetobacteraceae bacterium]|nr:OBAP family protein [Acetobacteraceae bacterium]